MSYSAWAYVMVGVKVPLRKLVLRQRRRGCDHFVMDNFCGKCGAPKWIGEDKFIEGFNGDDLWNEYFVYRCDEHVDAECDWAIIGKQVAHTDGEGAYSVGHMDIDYKPICDAFGATADDCGMWLIQEGG